MENKHITNSLDKIVDSYKAIEKLHQKIEDKKQEVNSPYNIKRYTHESRQEELDTFIEECDAKEKEIRKEMAKEVKNIEYEVCGAFQYNPEIAQQIDFLCTMARGHMLSANMISATAEKYKGSEATLLFLKQKLKDNGLTTTPIDNLLFSTTKVDLNGKSHFIPPTEYFNTLADSIENGVNDVTLFHNLDLISNKTGAESIKLESVKAEMKAHLEESISNMSPIF